MVQRSKASLLFDLTGHIARTIKANIPDIINDFNKPKYYFINMTNRFISISPQKDLTQFQNIRNWK